MAVGEQLLWDTPVEKTKSWAINLEDSSDELLRRLYATTKSFAAEWDEVREMVAVDSGHDQRIIIADSDRNGNVIPTVDAKALLEQIERHGFGYVSVDPFVRSHYVDENSNKEVDGVMAIFTEIASQTGCAIELVHHTRKSQQGTGGAAAGNAETARGASSLIAAVRSARTVMPMTTKEAEAFGIEEKRRNWFVRIDSAKANFHPPQEKATWCERISVELGNGDLAPGDSIGGLRRWSPPDPFDGLTNQLIADLLIAVNAGPGEGARCSAKSNYKSWVGHCITAELPHKSSSDAKQIVEAWLASLKRPAR